MGKRLAIAMTTAPRRVPTLHRALDSLRDAGFREKVHLLVEPGTFDRVPRPKSDRVRVRENSTTRGCFGNWKRALRHLISRTDARWLLVVQDDAIWAPHSADVLRAQMDARNGHRTGFLSPYVTDHEIHEGFVDDREGWNACRSGWEFWGALALCLPRSSAKKLLDHPRFIQHTSQDHVDSVIAASMQDLQRPIYVHVPSLVDHVGETSTIGHDDVAGTIRGYRFEEWKVTRSSTRH